MRSTRCHIKLKLIILVSTYKNNTTKLHQSIIEIQTQHRQQIKKFQKNIIQTKMKRSDSQTQLNSELVQQWRLANTVILSRVEARHVYRSPFTYFERFLQFQIETGSSFGRWVVPQTISDVTNIDVFCLACTVKKLFDIFSCVRNLAVNLSLKQTFVILTHTMTPSLSFYYCTLFILPSCAFWAINRHDMFLLCRGTPVNV
jgi:hypothetical protein